MKSEPVRAGADWLKLREPADAAARSRELVAELRSRLRFDREVFVIHDLGCGSGSMARWLSGQLSGPQHWVMSDRDHELLDLAAADPPRVARDGSPVTVETHRRDITRLDLRALAGTDLITASAVLDMMTAADVERFVATCAWAGCPVLIALSVTGQVELKPPDPFDRLVGDAFNGHQRRVTGGGRLLGPDAVARAVDEFTRLGLEVIVRPSHWQLGAGHGALVVQWFAGWLAAACEQQPGLSLEASAYARRRLREAAEGRLDVTVQHLDLLALPSAPDPNDQRGNVARPAG